MRLLLFFIVIPLTELWLLFEVADLVGGFETVLLVIMTAFFGIMLLKSQGVATLTRANQKWQMGAVPAQEMIEGLMLAFCGAMLLTPGFITDALGFLILLPPVRRFLAGRITQQGVASFVKGVAGETVIKRARPGAGQWQSRSFGGQVYEGKVTKSSFAANDAEPAAPDETHVNLKKSQDRAPDIEDAEIVDVDFIEAEVVKAEVVDDSAREAAHVDIEAVEIEIVAVDDAPDHKREQGVPSSPKEKGATVVSIDARSRRTDSEASNSESDNEPPPEPPSSK